MSYKREMSRDQAMILQKGKQEEPVDYKRI